MLSGLQFLLALHPLLVRDPTGCTQMPVHLLQSHLVVNSHVVRGRPVDVAEVHRVRHE